MDRPGTEQNPLRIAIIGAGPAGFYAAEHLFKQADVSVSVDLFDRLPTPYGLVRAGVAPDHQKIKNVTRIYQRTATNPAFRFFGNVEFGRDVMLDDLRTYYHGIVFTTGAQDDRRLDIPGEDLLRSHSATEFVAWYNGHPDYRDLQFDLTQKRAIVVGVGNVAMDVARILCRSVDELAETDIADYALDALRTSQVEEVVLLGRRAAAQAAFTTPEIKEVGELDTTDVIISAEDAALDPLSAEALEATPDRAASKTLEILGTYAAREPEGRPRRMVFRFLASPVSLSPAADGGVGSVRIVRNELYKTDSGGLRPRATDRFEDLEAGLVFRSVGYRGVALPGVPFHDRWGVIQNTDGRITDADGTALPGLYAAGWIKRGPSGVIGTNKACAVGTIQALLEDLSADTLPAAENPDPAAAESFIRSKQPRVFSHADWSAIDAIEMARGAASGRPRVKFTRIDEMWDALEK